MMLFLLMFFHPAVVFDGSPTLVKAREQFFLFDQNPCVSEELYQFLKKQQLNDDPLLIAYQGVSLSVSASCTYNPRAKLSRFNEGTKTIEKVLGEHPEQVEIRLLRMSIQLGAPFFLNYRTDIEQDREIIVNELTFEDGYFVDVTFKRNVVLFLLHKSHPTESQRVKLEKLLEDEE